MASSSLADRMQEARFDSHLTGVKKERFYWLTKTIANNKGFRESENKFAMFKIMKDKVNIQVLKVYRRLITLFKPFFFCKEI